MKYQFNVPDMSCNHCKMRISKALGEKQGIDDFSVDLDNKVVTVETSLSSEEIVSAIDEAGYDAEKV
ncbi:MAG: heavy-metal-associated domain-containing protein [Spirochaetia bacterium]